MLSRRNDAIGRGVGLLVGLVLAGWTACGDDGWEPPDPAGPTVRFKLSYGDDFFALPFPLDTRKTADGHLDLTGFPEASEVVNQYRDVVQQECTGFAVGGAIFFTLDEPVDETTLPADATDTLDPQASVYLVNVDTASPGYGERVPLWLKAVADSRSSFIGGHWLGLFPFPGHPLRQGTTYAAVITDRLHRSSGGSFEQDRDFAWVMATQECPDRVCRARAVFGPLFNWLSAEGIARDEVRGATVFTTQHVTDLVFLAREKIQTDPHPPQVENLVLVSREYQYDLYEAEYDTPIFQHGEAPYSLEGGNFIMGSDGLPVPARLETLRLAISVPDAEMPPGGWPVVLYAHGTGGDYMSFENNLTADRLALVSTATGEPLDRLAVMGIDGVLHGPRAGGSGESPEMLFYNFQNPLAGRDNSRQAAIDYFQLLRVAETLDVDSAPDTHRPIKFDPNRIYYMGHSQGGITGVLFVVAEPKIKAAVLSGAGAHLLLTLLRKETEFNIPAMLEIVINDDGYGALDEFHPVLTLAQTFIEPADTLPYARLFQHDIAAPMSPRNVFLSYGQDDSYTPNITTRALATAAGFEPAGTIFDAYEGMELYGSVTPLAPPVCENVSSPVGRATQVVVQYRPLPRDDGHFVVFDLPDAVFQFRSFLATHDASGCATLVEPP